MNKRKRKKKVAKLLKLIYADKNPMLRWQNYPDMPIVYDCKINCFFVKGCPYMFWEPDIESLNLASLTNDLEALKKRVVEKIKTVKNLTLLEQKTDKCRGTVVKNYVENYNRYGGPVLMWENYDNIKYVYNENTDTFDLEDGFSVLFTLKEGELFSKYRYFLMNELVEATILHYRKKYGIELIPLD